MTERKYRRITYQDRLKIEALYNAKVSVTKIAAELGFHHSCIYRELKNGYYDHMNGDWTFTRKYSADRAQQASDFNLAGRAKDLKIGKDYKFLDFIEKMIIKEHYSPRAALAEIRRRKLKFDTDVSYNTIYRYIDNGVFPHLTRSDLPYKPRKKYKKTIVVKKDSVFGKSIEIRPDEAASRETFGHWELDSVIGKRERGNTILVFTERKTRFEMIFRANDKSALSTVSVMNALESELGESFNKIFRSITCDNGCEFNASNALETSILGDHLRTSFFYCHPYSSSERGSNEKNNQMIRRWLPKGTRIEAYSDEYIQDVEDWLNDYPRGIFDFKSARDLFNLELKKLGIKNFA